MKKVGKVLLVVWAVLATFLLVMACIAYKEAKADHLVAYSILESEYKELQAEYAESPDEAVTDLLPYKLYYDAEMQILLGNDYDWEKAVAEAAEEYDLSEVEQLTLLKKVEWLMTMATTLAK